MSNYFTKRNLSILLPNLAGGGAERVSLWLAQEFLGRGHQVSFVLCRAEGELLFLVPEGVQVVDLGAARMRNALWPLVRHLRAADAPDALIANMWPLTSIAVTARALARSRTRLMLCDHSNYPFQIASAPFPPARRLSMAATMRPTYPFADAVVSVSNGVGAEVARLAGMPRARITTIHNPIAPLTPEWPLDRAQATWPAGSGPRLIAIGSIKAEKDYPTLLRALARLRQTRDARLLILGDGPLRGEIEALRASLGLDGAVAMPGFHMNPADLLQAADLAVLSSQSEGLPTVLIEALQFGLPIVSTDCPSGPAEILENGRYGRLVPVGDVDALAAAMAEALDATHDREALKRRAADFSPEIAARKYLDLLFPPAGSTAAPGARRTS